MRSTYRSCLIFAVLVLTTSHVVFSQADASPITLGRNIGLSLSENVATIDGNPYLSLSAPFLFGLSGGLDNPGQKQGMLLDISNSFIYVPQQSSSGFGITCDSTTNCQTTGTVEPQVAYKTIPVNGQTANTLLRFSSGKLKQSNFPSLLTFILSTMSSQWTQKFGNNGLFGFGPKSQLWNFIAQTYSPTTGQSYFDFSIYLVARDYKKLADQGSVKFDGSQITVNGRYTSGYQVVSSQADTSLGAWYFPSSQFKFSGYDRQPPKNGICIDSSTHALLILPPADQLSLLNLINNQLCGQASGCTPDNSKISGVDPITFTFNSTSGQTLEVKVPPSGFITFANGIAQIAVSSNDKVDTVCTNSPVAAGRLLLAFTEISVRMQVEGNKPKNFYLVASQVNLPSKWFYFWLIMVMIVILIFMLTTILIVRNYSPNRVYFHPENNPNVEEVPRTISD